MESTYSITQAARILGFKVGTLQKWDREGRLKPAFRTKTNRRVYTESQLNDFIGKQTEHKRTRVIAYCRVSSQAQKPDLQNQVTALTAFCVQSGIEGVEAVKEIGGGLNFKRPKFLEIMDAVERDEVKTLIIAHKDRLVRFGFEWFSRFLESHHCQLVILDNIALSPEQEMVQDLMTIVHCFSSRLYGLRNYKKKLKEALGGDENESIQDGDQPN